MVESFLALLQNMEATFNPGNPSGLLILFFLAVITDIGVPIPFVLDTILVLSAYRAWTAPHPLWIPVILIVVMLFIGRQAGSGILYLLSRLLGKVFLNWLRCHVPSIGNRLESFGARIEHWAPLTIATGRLTPGLLQLTSVTAGAIRLRYYYFAMGVAISSIIYDGILVLLAFIAAHSPRANDPDFTIWLLIALIAVVCILWPVIYVFSQRSARKAARLRATCDQPVRLTRKQDGR
jgi:membrane protein DedA with SNARE-associated domain